MNNSGDDVAVRPLGMLSPVPPRAFDLDPTMLVGRSALVPPEIRARVAEYLRSASMVFPLMEDTGDVIDGRFGLAGGSALMSDGLFYWRLDAADYVANYGVEVDVAALEHMAHNDWVPSLLGEMREREIEDYLDTL